MSEPSPREIWDALTPVQQRLLNRLRTREDYTGIEFLGHEGVRITTIRAMDRAGLLTSGKTGVMLHLTDLGRAVVEAGRETP